MGTGARANPVVTANWQPLIDALVLLLTAVVIPWGIMAYKARTAVAQLEQDRLLDDQARDALTNAARTSAYLLEHRIAQGQMTATDISERHPAVIAEAHALMARVPDAAARDNATVQGMAQVIVGQMQVPPEPASPLPA